MIKQHLKIIILIIILSAATIFWAITSLKEEVKYLTVKPKTGKIEQSVTTAGEIIAADLVLVGAQVSGQIKKMHVVLGQHVRKDNLIAEIDSAQQLHKLHMIKSLLQMNHAQLAVAQVNAREARHTLEITAQLVEKDFMPKEDLEKTKNARDLAEAKIRELTALVKKTQIELDKAKMDLSYTKIMAPIDGTVVSMPVKAGQTVNASQTAPTIVQLANLEKLEIKLLISEGDVTKVCPGMPVRFSILSDPKKVYVEPLVSIDPGPVHLSSAQDDMEKQEKEPIYYYGRVKINNANHAFQIGMTVKCCIISRSVEDTLTIPYDAVHRKEDKTYVLTQNQKGSIERREIVIGLQDEVNVQIVSGITAVDNIVLSKIGNREIESKIKSLY